MTPSPSASASAGVPLSATSSGSASPASTSPGTESSGSASAGSDLAAAPAPDLAAELLRTGRRLMLVGLTADGHRFRPSDWAERLASVMAPYRPGKTGRGARQPQLGYSPFVVPTEHDGNKCVIVDPRLREVEPLAWSFVVNFARDNGLRTTVL